MKITVVGSGYVGEASGRGLTKHGHEVIFLDIDHTKLDTLRQDGLEAYHPDDHARVASHVTMFSVNTPTEKGKANFEYLEKALCDFGKRLYDHDDYHNIVIRSTTLPGLTRNLFIPLVEKYSGKQAGRDFGVCVQPEYLRQATAQADFDRPWFTLIGELDRRSGDILEDIYQPFNSTIQRIGLEEAEIQKYIHNTFNAVKIAFFNEMRQICDAEHIDADAIFPSVAMSCEGCWNPMYGLRNFGPFDGACLPKDTEGLQAWANQNGYDTQIIDAVIDQNRRYAQFVHQTNSIPETGQLAVAMS